VTDAAELRHVELPCWQKSSFSTAGRGLRFVTSADEAHRAYLELEASAPVLAQQPASGRYAQMAGVFAHGRLVGVHASEQAGSGVGGSAAARRSVDHPEVRTHIERLGRQLGWHDGLTLDYLHENGRPRYIEANAGRPRRP
jgi:hypothetical protein